MKNLVKISKLLVITSFLLITGSSFAQGWELISDEDELRALFEGTEQTATLANNVKAIATYNSDGTGELKAWGDIFKRQWKVENETVGILIDGTWRYFHIAQKVGSENIFRANPLDGSAPVIFEVSDKEVLVKNPQHKDQGGAVEPSADEVAKALANPNTPLAKLTTKIQYRTFDGSLPNASSQSSATLLLQPSFPFALSNGDVVFFRPAIPIIFGQPTINASGGFNSKTGLGDIGFDLAYGRTNKETGLLTALGMVATLPTASPNALGGRNFNIGPEVLIGLIKAKYVIGAFPNHQWKVAGNGVATSLTTVQLFANLLPGKAWVVGTAPIMNYDWNNEQWNIPLNLTLGKTYVLGGRPWSFSFEANYFVEASEVFGQEWFVGFSASPVVKNVLAGLFK